MKENKRNKSTVILRVERSEGPSRSNVTSVEPVVNDGAKTQPRHVLERSFLLRASACFAHSFFSGSPRGAVTSLLAGKLRPSLTNNILRLFVFLRRQLAYGSRLKITALYFLLSFNLSTALANKSGCDCGITGHETECCWEITEVTKNGKTEKVLTIYPGTDENGNTYTNVQMKNYIRIDDVEAINEYPYSTTSDAPWARQGVTSLKVENGINNIGSNAFRGETKIIEADIPNVKSIGDNVFEGTLSLESIDLPNITNIPWAAFYDTGSLKYIGFSTEKDTKGCLINDKGDRLTNGTNNCITEISIAGNAFTNSHLRNCASNGSNCGSCGYKYIKSGRGCVSDCGAGYLGKEGRCIDAKLGCGENYRQIENWCNRIRYTPAEAAKVLNDDDNSITITFKK